MGNPFGDRLGTLFKKVPRPEQTLNRDVAPGPAGNKDSQRQAIFGQGDLIGYDYEVKRVIGEGGFGVVYLVYWHATGNVLALKTFRDEFLADQEVRQHFRREASIWIELGRHPYLVHAYLVTEISGRLYIAMEYVAPNEEGLNSLDGYLEKQPPDLAQSLRWAVQICYGMEYAYSKGVRAHRDLKPANIMITQDLTAKITDFGIAGVSSEGLVMGAAGLNVQTEEPGLSGRTRIGTGMGTPTHMAPEQFANAAGCDERSDIYSFGIVLYQMVTGGYRSFLCTETVLLRHGRTSGGCTVRHQFPLWIRPCSLSSSAACRSHRRTGIRHSGRRGPTWNSCCGVRQGKRSFLHG
jgi:serine/threonine protein kinase